MMEQRLRPWVDKKIREYIGEEEPSLVGFICDKIRDKTRPEQILKDLTMVGENYWNFQLINFNFLSFFYFKNNF